MSARSPRSRRARALSCAHEPMSTLIACHTVPYRSPPSLWQCTQRIAIGRAGLMLLFSSLRLRRARHGQEKIPQLHSEDSFSARIHRFASIQRGSSAECGQAQ